MGDRRELEAAHGALQKSYEEIKQQMIDKKATPDQLAKLNRMYQDKYNSLKSEMGDSLQKLNIGEKIPVSGATTSGVGINQAKMPDMAKQVNLGKEGMFKKAADVGGDVLGSAKKAGFKKLLGAVPLLGGIASAAMTGDASAAIPGLDQESAGPAKGSPDDLIQSGKVAGPEIQAQMEQARQQMLQHPDLNKESPEQTLAKQLALYKQRNNSKTNDQGFERKSDFDKNLDSGFEREIPKSNAIPLPSPDDEDVTDIPERQYQLGTLRRLLQQKGR